MSRTIQFDDLQPDQPKLPKLSISQRKMPRDPLFHRQFEIQYLPPEVPPQFSKNKSLCGAVASKGREIANLDCQEQPKKGLRERPWGS